MDRACRAETQYCLLRVRLEDLKPDLRLGSLINLIKQSPKTLGTLLLLGFWGGINKQEQILNRLSRFLFLEVCFPAREATVNGLMEEGSWAMCRISGLGFGDVWGYIFNRVRGVITTGAHTQRPGLVFVGQGVQL